MNLSLNCFDCFKLLRLNNAKLIISKIIIAISIIVEFFVRLRITISTKPYSYKNCTNSIIFRVNL